jgi:hypothetical protein
MSLPAEDPGYRVICISFYTDDLARLDEAVAALKRLGHRKVNRSSLLREALRQLELDCVPRSL